MTRHFTFIGVSTAQSAIMQIFPRWRDALGLPPDVEIEGCDLPLHAPVQRYREVVEALKDDPLRLGALITTHKIDLFHAASDLFDEVDPFASLCGEVSCIARRGGRLLGWAKDPISAGRALEGMLGPRYFEGTGGHFLCFGAGGAGVAITLHLLSRPEAADRPAAMTVTDLSLERLEALRALHERVGGAGHVRYVHTGDQDLNGELTAGLPPGSLVVNATGMGKDVPGSPLRDTARFPRAGIAWELNYRGDLTFLQQAHAQKSTRGLRVEDGWQYFIYGWTSVMEEVFDRRFSEGELRTMSSLASDARPSPPYTRQ